MGSTVVDILPDRSTVVRAIDDESYAEITLVIEGALDGGINISTTAGREEVEDFIARECAEAERTGAWTQVYVLDHPHAPDLECECAQYATSNLPEANWNSPDEQESGGRWEG